MSENEKELEALVLDIQRALDELKARDGSDWEMALGELQLPYKEVAIWILLDKPDQARTALGAFRDIIKPYQDNWSWLNFTVSFNAIEGEENLFIDHIEGRDIHSKEKIENIGKRVDREPLSENDMFVRVRRERAKQD